MHGACSGKPLAEEGLNLLKLFYFPKCVRTAGMRFVELLDFFFSC